MPSGRDNKYIRRNLLAALAGHIDQPEITMLTGPRQSGKTTMLKQLEADLRGQGRKTLWLNLDFEDDFYHVASQGALLQKIQLELGKGGGVVFIDEIQRKENAGIFCHTNPWIMIAETKIGRGDQAYDYYMRINPSRREEISDLHKCEPYVYPQMIAGKDAPTHGEAKNSWLSGTAAMNYVAITQAILGIRPQYDGLEIRPVIPSGWSGLEAVRYFRGIRYEISMIRRGPGNEVALLVGGKPVPGTVIPSPTGSISVLNVIAYIG